MLTAEEAKQITKDSQKKIQEEEEKQNIKRLSIISEQIKKVAKKGENFIIWCSNFITLNYDEHFWYLDDREKEILEMHGYKVSKNIFDNYVISWE